MNERLLAYNLNLAHPNEGSAASADEAIVMVPFAATIVYVSVSPKTDDAGATIDLNDDGTGVITGVDASDHDVPGEWQSTHVGGSNDPVVVAAGSELQIDVNGAANGNRFDITILFLVGEGWG